MQNFIHLLQPQRRIVKKISFYHVDWITWDTALSAFCFIVEKDRCVECHKQSSGRTMPKKCMHPSQIPESWLSTGLNKIYCISDCVKNPRYPVPTRKILALFIYIISLRKHISRCPYAILQTKLMSDAPMFTSGDISGKEIKKKERKRKKETIKCCSLSRLQYPADFFRFSLWLSLMLMDFAYTKFMVSVTWHNRVTTVINTYVQTLSLLDQRLLLRLNVKTKKKKIYSKKLQ